MAACTLTLDGLRSLAPCSDRFSVIAPHFKGKALTASQAVRAGATLDDLVWVTSACARKDKDVERRLRMWMADCAARVLHIYEKSDGATSAPRDAIIAARAFANGEIDTAARAAARAAAWDAARDAARAAARDAARAAAWDAARAAARAAAWDAARAAARAAAWDAAWDAARDAARDAAWDAARAAEEQWQLDRLVVWLSGREPKPLALLASPSKGDL